MYRMQKPEQESRVVTVVVGIGLVQRVKKFVTAAVSVRVSRSLIYNFSFPSRTSFSKSIHLALNPQTPVASAVLEL